MHTDFHANAACRLMHPAEAEHGYASARDYDEYRVKLYKVACRAAHDQLEQLRLDWERRNRERG